MISRETITPSSSRNAKKTTIKSTTASKTSPINQRFMLLQQLYGVIISMLIEFQLITSKHLKRWATKEKTKSTCQELPHSSSKQYLIWTLMPTISSIFITLKLKHSRMTQSGNWNGTQSIQVLRVKNWLLGLSSTDWLTKKIEANKERSNLTC